MLDILIVEDNMEIAALLCDFLRKENYVVSIADTGEKAIDIYEKYGAKLILLDIMLPGMDGFAVCSKIRESSNTHILIASAKTEKNDKLKGLNLGADDYIEKPYDIDILIAKIKGIFKRKYAQEEIVEGDEWIYFDEPFEKPEGGSKTFDAAGLEEGRYKLAIVCSSSVRGAYFEGAVGSTLYVDDLRLICRP